MIHQYFFNENEQNTTIWCGWKGKCNRNLHSTVSQRHNCKTQGQLQNTVDGTQRVKYAIVKFYIKVSILKPRCDNGCYCKKSKEKNPTVIELFILLKTIWTYSTKTETISAYAITGNSSEKELLLEQKFALTFSEKYTKRLYKLGLHAAI